MDPTIETEAEIQAQNALDDMSEREIIDYAVKRGILDSGGTMWNQLIESVRNTLIEDFWEDNSDDGQ
jgi:hypothetical protein